MKETEEKSVMNLWDAMVDSGSEMNWIAFIELVRDVQTPDVKIEIEAQGIQARDMLEAFNKYYEEPEPIITDVEYVVPMLRHEEQSVGMDEPEPSITDVEEMVAMLQREEESVGRDEMEKAADDVLRQIRYNQEKRKAKRKLDAMGYGASTYDGPKYVMMDDKNAPLGYRWVLEKEEK